MRQPIPFGKYLLLERISVGGMAEVFKAKSFGIEGFEKIIAIKRILPTMAEDADFIRMFIDEAKIAGQLSHANICQIFELGKIVDSHFIAMEFIWGKDVLQIENRFRRLRQHMPAQMVAFVGAKICEGLDYAHRKKDPLGRPLAIVHRDISPQNVLVSYEGEVKLIDFGIAKAASRSSKTQAGVLKGKFGYMSPEQVRGLPLDRRSDLFAVGTILHEMLTGDRLFVGESDFSTLEKVRNADVTPPSQINTSVPPALERIIMKALAREPEDRYQWANEMQEELLSFMMGVEPVYTAKHLAQWMKEAFKQELDKERLLLEQYKKLGRETLNQEVSSDDEDDQPEPVPRSAGTVALSVDDIEEEPAFGEATMIGGPSFGDPPVVQGPASMEPSPAVGRKSGGGVADFGEEGATEIWGEVAAKDGPSPVAAISEATVSLAGAPPGAPLAQQPTAPPPGQVRVSFIAPGVQSPGAQAPGGGSAAVPPRVEDLLGSSVGQAATLPAPRGARPLVDVDQLLREPVPAVGSKPGPSARPSSGNTASVAALQPSTSSIVAPRRAGFASDVAIGVGLALLVVALGAGGYWYFTHRGSAPRVTATAETGTILVASSDGAAADILINGAQKGRLSGSDHLKIEGLPPGEYQVVARRAGVADFMSKVVLGPNGTELVMCRFEAKRAGTLKLDVVTQGVTILVDNQEISAAAMREPLELTPEAAHEILARREGFEAKVNMVTLKPGETQVLRIELTPATKGSRGSSGTGAGVPAAGGGRSSSAGSSSAGSSGGSGSAGSGSGGSGSTGSGGTSASGGTRVTAGSGSRSAGSSGSGSTTGRQTGGGTSPSGIIDLGVRTNGTGGSGGGHTTGQGDAAVADVGYLIANTTPWARVIIDGRDTGKMTPIAPRSKISLQPGRHTVTFVVGGQKFSYPINIEAGKDHRLVKDLPVQ